jgi:hypothetical protein
MGLTYTITKRRSPDPVIPVTVSDRIHFYAIDKNRNDCKFKIDMNIKTSISNSFYYVNIFELNVNAVSLIRLLTEKLNVMGTQKICRRVKDLFDAYAISHLVDFSLINFCDEWSSNSTCKLDEAGIYFLRSDNLDSIARLRQTDWY